MTTKAQPWKVSPGSINGLFIIHDKSDRIGINPRWNGTTVYHYGTVDFGYWKCEEHGTVGCAHISAAQKYEAEGGTP